MAVKLEGSIKRFIGLSTDEKPFPGQVTVADDGSRSTLASLPAGSSFYETDTGYISRWSGSAWSTPTPPLNEIGDQLALIYEELRDFHVMVAMTLNQIPPG